MQSTNTKSHNRSLEGLLNKQLKDLIVCLSFRAFSPIQARVILCVALNTQLSYSTVVLYRDHEGLGILAQNYLHKTSLIFAIREFGSNGLA